MSFTKIVAIHGPGRITYQGDIIEIHADGKITIKIDNKLYTGFPVKK